MKELENESDFETPKGGEFIVVEGVKGMAFEVGLAGGGGVEGT